MHCKSLILFLAGFSAAVAAGIPVELQEKKADGLNGWSRGAEKIVRFVEEGERKDVLEIRLEKPVRNHVYGITRALDPAGIAGRRVTLSAEVWRDIRVYQKWQGGKLMISVRFPNGKYGYYGLYMSPGVADWTTLSKSFDIPQDIVAANLFLGIQGGCGVIRYCGLKMETGDTVLNLSGVANMGYQDPVSGDGKGGWSDQGPENDAAKFRWKQSVFGNVPFHLIRPEENGGKCVMTFANRRFPNGLHSAEIKLGKGERSAKYLYVLHTLTFPDSYPPVGRILLDGSAGSQELRIVNGRDISNWWMPLKRPNAFPVSLWSTGGGNQVGVYLSRFPLKKIGSVRSIRFEKEAGSSANWIVLGATLSNTDYPVPKTEPLVMRPGAVWKVLPLPAKGGVIAGSALDLSFLNDGKPTGTYGRVIINRDGHFAFEKSPERPVRFLASAEAAASFRGFWTNKPQFDTKEKIREYVRQLRLAGYNMIRIHFLDEILLTRAKKDLDFHPDFLDRFDFLVAECGKNGIYLNMDAMTGRLGYAKGVRWGSKADPGNFKYEIYFSERVRTIWKEGVRKLFTHVNPYTGKRLVDDPTVAMVVGYNEQEFALSPGFCKDYAPLLPQWRAFLKEKYATIQSLRSAWGKTAPDAFDAVPIFQKDDLYRTDSYGRDINTFLCGLENKIFHFYKNFLREIGYPGPVSAMNMGKTFRHAIARRDYDFIAMNGYHAHPNGFTNNGGGSGSISQESSIGNAANEFRGFGSMRRDGVPYVVTEHLHVFWNRYRYEQAFVTGAYSAYQDFDALTGFGSAITVNAYAKMMPFFINNDPIAKTQELLTALIFRRRDVSPGKQKIRLALSSEEILKNGASHDALSTAQGKLMFTNRFSYSCDLRKAPGKNETVLGRSGGSGVILDDWYASIADSSGSSAFQLDSFLNDLRKKGALPKNNPSSDAKGVFQTDTGELRMETARNYLQVDTPRLQGICAEAGSRAGLSDFEVRKMTVRGNVALASIDGTLPIREAKRLLLVVATNVLQNNMAFEDPEMRFMLKLGDLPLLVQTGIFDVAFRNRNAAAMKAYALGMDGKRLAELPLRKNGDRVELLLDTAAFPSGPALYFEFVEHGKELGR